MTDVNLIGIIIAIVGTGIAIVAAVLSMMFWCRQESNSLRLEAKEDRKDLMQISRNLELAVIAIQAEVKDFHNRLVEAEKIRVRT
jgi:flagellar biosynthesis/type III secretory pathway M-ring protein FliF/YscJ